MYTPRLSNHYPLPSSAIPVSSLFDQCFLFLSVLTRLEPPPFRFEGELDPH